MTYEEAASLKSFKHYCNCGGYAWTMSGRDPEHPHMDYCPQREEYAEWRAALRPITPEKDNGDHPHL